MLKPVRTIGEIDDLRLHRKFWEWCEINGLLSCSRQLLNEERPTRDTIRAFAATPGETIRQWEWLQRFRREGYTPKPGDEIAVHKDMRPYNGTHRASALHALGRRVPALIIEPIDHL